MVADRKDAPNYGGMAPLVRLIEKEGPYINRIARTLGESKDSVRYRYRHAILKNGFRIQAKPNYERLGMKRLILLGDLGDEWRANEARLSTFLNENCYFVNFNRTLLDSRVLANVSIPPRFVDQFTRLLSELASRNVLHVEDTYSFDSFRNPPMRAEYYDFDRDRWDFDWGSHADTALEGAERPDPEQASFSYEDLLIIKELQIDATRSLTEIARKLKLEYKRVLRRFQHIEAEGLIRGYRVIWSKDAVDLKRNLIPTPKHRYLPIFFLVRNTTTAEAGRLMAASARFPYLSAEAIGKDYFAQAFIPREQITEGLKYVTDLAEQTKERTEFGFVDFEHSRVFTIPYQMFDQDARQWTFNPQGVLEGLEQMKLVRKEKVRQSQ